MTTAVETFPTHSTEHTTLTTMYLITNTTKAFAFVSDQETAHFIYNRLQQHYTTLGPFFMQKISTFIPRIYEIGQNLFHRQELSQQLATKTNEEILNFRNTIINEFLQKCSTIENANPTYVWKKMRCTYPLLKDFETMESFHSYIMDTLKFIRKLL